MLRSQDPIVRGFFVWQLIVDIHTVITLSLLTLELSFGPSTYTLDFQAPSSYTLIWCWFFCNGPINFVWSRLIWWCYPCCASSSRESLPFSQQHQQQRHQPLLVNQERENEIVPTRCSRAFVYYNVLVLLAGVVLLVAVYDQLSGSQKPKTFVPLALVVLPLVFLSVEACCVLVFLDAILTFCH